MNGSWEKLCTKNDWGYVTVHIGSTDGPKVEPGKYLVRWPDGWQEEVTVSTRFPMPVVELGYHGVKVTVDLVKTGCEVWREGEEL